MEKCCEVIIRHLSENKGEGTAYEIVCRFGDKEAVVWGPEERQPTSAEVADVMDRQFNGHAFGP